MFFSIIQIGLFTRNKIQNLSTIKLVRLSKFRNEMLESGNYKNSLNCSCLLHIGNRLSRLYYFRLKKYLPK